MDSTWKHPVFSLIGQTHSKAGMGWIILPHVFQESSNIPSLSCQWRPTSPLHQSPSVGIPPRVFCRNRCHRCPATTVVVQRRLAPRRTVTRFGAFHKGCHWINARDSQRKSLRSSLAMLGNRQPSWLICECSVKSVNILGQRAFELDWLQDFTGVGKRHAKEQQAWSSLLATPIDNPSRMSHPKRNEFFAHPYTSANPE